MKNILITQRIGKDKYGEYYDYLESTYIKYLNQYKINPIILPNNTKDVIKFYKKNRCTHIILTGGDDICPSLYSKKARKLNSNLYQRDLNEQILIKYSIEKKIPVLGICRGFQIINVCLGGKLTKDICKITKSINNKKHKVNFTKDFVKKVKKNSIIVNSYHNQGITQPQLAANLVPLGFSEDGKLVEIYNHVKLPIIGIQWHPERKNFCKDFDKYIFKLFLK
jgi:putative glutamine amidotransferase